MAKSLSLYKKKECQSQKWWISAGWVFAGEGRVLAQMNSQEVACTQGTCMTLSPPKSQRGLEGVYDAPHVNEELLAFDEYEEM